MICLSLGIWTEICKTSVQFSSLQFLSRVRLFVTPCITAHQGSLTNTNSWSSLKLTSIESVMPSSHLILCRPLLLPPSIFPSIRVFSSESVLHIRWPEYWSFSFSISPSSEYAGLILTLLSTQMSSQKKAFQNNPISLYHLPYFSLL